MSNNNLSLPLFEVLNTEKIVSYIAPQQLCYLAQLEIFTTIDSTNHYLIEKAKTYPTGSFCLAEEQTAGRGRCGRLWHSPYGAPIACSLLWRFKEQKDVSSLSIAVGVMVAHALRKYGLTEGLQLKWPNDILFAGRKLGGILLEKAGESVVIGIGININLPSPKIKERIDMTEIMGKPIMRNNLIGILMNELLCHLPAFQKNGLKEYRNDWRQWDYLRDCRVNVFTSQETITGIAQGISEHGELVLKDEYHHVRLFRYGEVSVRK